MRPATRSHLHRSEGPAAVRPAALRPRIREVQGRLYASTSPLILATVPQHLESAGATMLVNQGVPFGQCHVSVLSSSKSCAVDFFTFCRVESGPTPGHASGPLPGAPVPHRCHRRPLPPSAAASTPGSRRSHVSRPRSTLIIVTAFGIRSVSSRQVKVRITRRAGAW